MLRPHVPKISTLPRPSTAAATHFNLYQLLTERKRLQQEIARLEQRHARLCQRLSAIDQQVASIEPSRHSAPLSPPRQPSAAAVNTLFLEY